MEGDEEKQAKRADEPMPDVEAMPDDMDFDDDVLGLTSAPPKPRAAPCPPCPPPPMQLDIAAAQRPPADS